MNGGAWSSGGGGPMGVEGVVVCWWWGRGGVEKAVAMIVDGGRFSMGSFGGSIVRGENVRWMWFSSIAVSQLQAVWFASPQAIADSPLVSDVQDLGSRAR